jgi:putative nucleotidyltransferase with HDIG domain
MAEPAGTPPRHSTNEEMCMQEIVELERKVRELSTLLEVSRILNADLNLERVLRTVLEQAIEVIGAEGGTLWCVEEQGTLILPRASVGPSSATILTVSMRPGEGIVGRVIQTGVGDLVADVRQDGRWSNRVDSATGFETRSIVSAPLTSSRGTLGCVQLVNKRGGQLFTRSDLDLLTALGAQAALVIENSRLLEKTRAFARNLEAAWNGTLEALTAALATRDTDTKGHCCRTVEMAVLLARRMGRPADELPAIARGALLHDIGKIGLPDSILFKPGRLTIEERETMKQHVKLGHEMLRNIEFFNDALPVVLYHHENYNGTGYLNGLKGEEIPLSARIFHVVDVYDALISQRPYKPAWPHDLAMAEIKREAGHSFDPAVVAALIQLTPEEVAWVRTLEDFLPETQALLGREIRHQD